MGPAGRETANPRAAGEDVVPSVPKFRRTFAFDSIHSGRG